MFAVPKISKGEKVCYFLKEVFIKSWKYFQVVHKNLYSLSMIPPATKEKKENNNHNSNDSNSNRL